VDKDKARARDGLLFLISNLEKFGHIDAYNAARARIFVATLSDQEVEHTYPSVVACTRCGAELVWGWRHLDTCKVPEDDGHSLKRLPEYTDQ
jgi:hypothetical protein